MDPRKNSLEEMLKMRCVPLIDMIQEGSTTACIAQLLFLQAQDRKEVVTLCIDSPGGFVKNSLAIIRTMDDLSCPVSTFVSAQAGGVAAVVAAHGLKGSRFAVTGARFAFTPIWADPNEGHIGVELSQFPQLLAELLCEDARRHETEILGWLRNSSEFSAEEALSLGLIDAIAHERS